jgi:hypothetical protein
LADRHYEEEIRKNCTAASIWAATHHYIYSRQILTLISRQQVPTSKALRRPHSLHTLVGTAGLRAMVAV